MNVLEEWYEWLTNYMASYGWRMVALALAYYFLKPYLYEWWDNMKSIDPAEMERKRILDKEMKRARREQAIRLSGKV